MEFDLGSVINQVQQEEIEALMHEKYKEPEEEIKAYTLTEEEQKKYIKSLTFGTMRGA
jgi:hypothetical protein